MIAILFIVIDYIIYSFTAFNSYAIALAIPFSKNLKIPICYFLILALIDWHYIIFLVSFLIVYFIDSKLNRKFASKAVVVLFRCLIDYGLFFLISKVVSNLVLRIGV